jgi:hypothetical protein
MAFHPCRRLHFESVVDTLVKAAPFVHGCSIDEEFHFGLSMLLAGIDELHRRLNPAPRPDPTKPDVDDATQSRNSGQR